LDQDEALKKSEFLKSSLLYMLAGECRDQQGKNSENEIKEASNLFLKYSKDKNSKKYQRCITLCFKISFEFR